MKQVNRTIGFFSTSAVLFVLGVARGGDQIGTSITFQGQLNNRTANVNDTCDLTVSLWDDASNGMMIGTPNEIAGVVVHEGVFSAKVDFGPASFVGERRWLQFAARCTGDVAPVVILPRQEVKSLPQARLARAATEQTPRGVIAMWSAPIASIPAGWALCDGTNGTPDLSDRFVFGATDAESFGTIGGALTHSHQVAAHTHAAIPEPISTQSAGGHAHVLFPHQHAIDYGPTNTSAAGDHTHNVDPPPANTPLGGAHSHVVDPPNANVSVVGSHNHGGATGQTCGDGGVALAKEDEGNVQCHSHSISAAGMHAHSFDVPGTSSGSGGVHSHQVDIQALISPPSGPHMHSLDLPVLQTSFSGVGSTTVNGAHTHHLGFNPVQSSSSAAQAVDASNLPPFYTLAFIMKL